MIDLNKTKTTAAMLVMLVTTAGGAAAEDHEGNDPEEEVQAVLLGLRDYLVEESAALAQNVTSNDTVQQKLDYILAYILDAVNSLPAPDDVVCYTFEVAPINSPVQFDLPASPNDERRGHVKVAGYGYDMEWQTVGPGYHTFKFESTGQILCQPFQGGLIPQGRLIHPGTVIQWRGS